MSEKINSKYLQAGLVVASAIVASCATALLFVQSVDEKTVERDQACEPILSQLAEVHELREEKRTRVEALLGQQELGNNPFDDQVVDYEYKTWQLQDAALDRRGDDLVREFTVLNCPQQSRSE